MAALSCWACSSPVAESRQGLCGRTRAKSFFRILSPLRRPLSGIVVSPQRISARISTSDRVNAGAQITVQDFLEEARDFGKVHLYINTHTGQWKTRTPVDLFRYSDDEKDAWDACIVHDDGRTEVDMYIRRVAWATFKQDKVLGVPYYIVQFISLQGIAFSLTLMADPKTQEYEPKQLETYNALLKKYGPELKFSNRLYPAKSTPEAEKLD